MRNLENISLRRVCKRSEHSFLYDARGVPSREREGKECKYSWEYGARICLRGSEIFQSPDLPVMFSCIQRFGTPDTWFMPNAEIRKRQVSPDGQESLLISLPLGSMLPVSELSHHEPNLFGTRACGLVQPQRH